jgi:hypothetical protein
VRRRGRTGEVAVGPAVDQPPKLKQRFTPKTVKQNWPAPLPLALPEPVHTPLMQVTVVLHEPVPVLLHDPEDDELVAEAEPKAMPPPEVEVDEEVEVEPLGDV